MRQQPLIAIINDNPAFLEFIREFIEHDTSYDVITGEKGENAIETVLRNSPDLVVLDIVMETRRHGYDVLQTMRQDPVLHDTPVIVCTADEEFIRDTAHELEALNSDWILKPFDLNDLISKIEDSLTETESATV